MQVVILDTHISDLIMTSSKLHGNLHEDGELHDGCWTRKYEGRSIKVFDLV